MQCPPQGRQHCALRNHRAAPQALERALPHRQDPGRVHALGPRMRCPRMAAHRDGCATLCRAAIETRPPDLSAPRSAQTLQQSGKRRLPAALRTRLTASLRGTVVVHAGGVQRTSRLLHGIHSDYLMCDTNRFCARRCSTTAFWRCRVRAARYTYGLHISVFHHRRD